MSLSGRDWAIFAGAPGTRDVARYTGQRAKVSLAQI